MSISTISTHAMHLQRRDAIATAQKRIASLSNEIASGYKADVAASLGRTTGHLIGLRNKFQQAAEMKQTMTSTASRMSMMQSQIVQTDKLGSDFLALATPNAADPTHSAKTLRQEALTTIESIVGALNVSMPGRFLFSGVNGENQALHAPNERSPSTGTTPMEAMAALVAANPPVDGASAADLAAAIDAAFASDAAADPTHRFEGTFYGGTPAVDGAGNPSPRVSTQIDRSVSMDYGVQANDKSVRDILKGLYMFAAVDVSTLPADAYDAYVGEAYAALGNGLDGLRADGARLGGQEVAVKEAIERQDAQMAYLNIQINSMEQSDPYEAHAHMSSLEAQLQASMNLTVRLSALSLVNFLR